ncbi:MAG: putative Zn-dependent protease [Flavobacteriales bacterium]|jgi:predicted Zn-dependent protease
MRIKTFYFILISTLLFSCAKNPVTGKRQVVFTSEKGERQMGVTADPQIVASFGLYENATLQNYINNRGNEMAKISHRPNLEYEFKIVDSPVVNAFAVPGGFVYFTRGIMAHFNNEAEFSGVLGHELGHITARHSVIQQRNAILGQIGLIGSMIAVPELAQFAEPVTQGMGLLMLKFGRDAESQSDKLGVEYSSRIGYDAEEMAGFFNTLARKQEEAGVSIPEFLSTHPNPINRKANVSAMAKEWQSELNLNNAKVGRDSYLAMIEGLVYGEDPRQGFVEANSFYHPTLKFFFKIPPAWQTQNSPQQFQMAPEDGKALMFLTLAEGSDLQAATAKSLEQFQMTAISSKNNIINGFQAVEVLAQQVQEQMTIKAKLTFIKYENNIYQIVGLSRDVDFNALASKFSYCMSSFKKLTDPEKLNRKPERLHIVSVKSNGTFSKALKDHGVTDKRLEELSILNGFMLNDQVKQGVKMKVTIK